MNYLDALNVFWVTGELNIYCAVKLTVYIKSFITLYFTLCLLMCCYEYLPGNLMSCLTISL